MWFESCIDECATCLIWNLCFMSLNWVEATKNICWVKSEDATDHSTVTSWFKKFCSGCKNPNNQAKSGGPKSMDS